ncbi:MAG: GNAT family N-acetyltransferase [Bacteroidota bacterium]|nr:GNAT family N-acetyltransferase [Bacteroidota bacterium]
MTEVRKAKIEELPAIEEVARVVYTDTFGLHFTAEGLENFLAANFGLERLLAEYNEPGSQLYIAMEDGVAIGFLRMRPNRNMEIHQLFVHRDYHGKGVADRLMMEAFHYARGSQWLWVAVWDGNLRAQRFYEKWGFKRFKQHVYEVDGEKQVDWLMRRACADPGVGPASTRSEKK